MNAANVMQIAVAAAGGAAVPMLAWQFGLRRRFEERVRQREREARDPLTDLPNRALLLERAGRLIDQAREGRWRVAVLSVDLDRFKAVNDAFGQAYGDEVLREVAGRLRACAGPEDVVARVSSDEFALVLACVEGEHHAASTARRVAQMLHRPHHLDGSQVYCTASIGIATHPRDGTDAACLLRNADLAMQHAKEAGRNSQRHFEPQMLAAATRRVQLEMALRGALGRGEFELHYQPRVNAVTRQATGFEALLRWNHPEHGTLSPGVFVPILEETNLIVEVGEWVVETVCRQIRAWQDRGLRALPVAVNLSARQFRDGDLDSLVARALVRSGIAPTLLEVELTESLLMQDPDEAVRTLRALEAYGVRLAVDDFGTGYSSLAYLGRFPVDTLKIDRAFIRELDLNGETLPIVRSIVQLAHGLGLCVVAEGVESEAQATLLAGEGCDEMQGFLFSRPIDARAAESFMPRQFPAPSAAVAA
jgi:diguanylate cyclase (GGDEF)-like protein